MSASVAGCRCRGIQRVTASGPGRVKTRVTGRHFMNFSRYSAVFGHYRLGRGQKLAPDAPFAGNFRVFTQSGSRAADVPDRRVAVAARPNSNATLAVEPHVFHAPAIVLAVDHDGQP